MVAESTMPVFAVQGRILCCGRCGEFGGQLWGGPAPETEIGRDEDGLEAFHGSRGRKVIFTGAKGGPLGARKTVAQQLAVEPHAPAHGVARAGTDPHNIALAVTVIVIV